VFHAAWRLFCLGFSRMLLLSRKSAQLSASVVDAHSSRTDSISPNDPRHTARYSRTARRRFWGLVEAVTIREKTATVLRWRAAASVATGSYCRQALVPHPGDYPWERSGYKGLPAGNCNCGTSPAKNRTIPQAVIRCTSPCAPDVPGRQLSPRADAHSISRIVLRMRRYGVAFGTGACCC
jgi:hypothetical protein